MDEWTGSRTSPAVRVSILSIASIVSLSIKKKRDIFRCDWENENSLIIPLTNEVANFFVMEEIYVRC